MNKWYSIVLLLCCTSCVGLSSTNLISTLFTPTNVVSTITDLGIEQETGKKVSEHTLSAVTAKDCKINLSDMTLCKDITKY